MNPLAELANEIILIKNEEHKNDPIPNGAVIGFESLKEFVNTNQRPTPSEWKVPSYYKDVADHVAYLRTIELPETVATIYVVKVPQQSKDSWIEEYYVPPISELIHDPEYFGFSEELDRERALEIKRHFLVWKKSLLGQEYSIGYKHIHTIGLDSNHRTNNWMTFTNKTAAEEYHKHIVSADIKPSVVDRAFSDLLEKLTDDFEDWISCSLNFEENIII